jgi:asparagine synthase (glutamine-hydrolysing)
MCGIAGIYTAHLPDNDLRATLERVGPSVHRGPGAGGVVTFDQPRGGLATMRLSSVGLEHGDQPMPGEDSTVVALLNSETCNHPELRIRLLARGHHFRGYSGTGTEGAW